MLFTSVYAKVLIFCIGYFRSQLFFALSDIDIGQIGHKKVANPQGLATI